MSEANRGKVAEKKVHAELKKLEGDLLRFTFNRISDARSAGGKGGVAQPGDFQAFYQNERGARFNFLIEVKEVDHDYRLPHKNFSDDKIARMRKRQLAGSGCFVLILHTPSKTWRCLEADFFYQKEGGSWDFRGIPLISLPEALKEWMMLD